MRQPGVHQKLREKAQKQDPATLKCSNYLASHPSKVCLHSGLIEPHRAQSLHLRALWCCRSAGTLPSFSLFIHTVLHPLVKSETPSRQASEPTSTAGVAYRTWAGEGPIVLSLRAGRRLRSGLETENILDGAGSYKYQSAWTAHCFLVAELHEKAT